MEQIQIVWNERISGYLPDTIKGDNLAILCFFLLDDVGYYAINMFRGWLDDPCSNQNSSNYSYQQKKIRHIVIANILSWAESKDEIFETTIDELHGILNQWEKLLKQKPNTIIIHKENDTIILKGKN